jgi:hypothetical protein
MRFPTHPDADPPTNGFDYQSVGTHVFKQASSSRTALDISSFSYQSNSVSSLFSFTLLHVFQFPSRLGTCACGPAVHLVPRFLSHHLCSCQTYLGRHYPPRSRYLSSFGSRGSQEQRQQEEPPPSPSILSVCVL